MIDRVLHCYYTTEHIYIFAVASSNYIHPGDPLNILNQFDKISNINE